MCRDTVGAAPVKRCTCAASAIFSYGSRGTPGWANTLNLVPELAKAQDGTSIRSAFRAAATAVLSTMGGTPARIAAPVAAWMNRFRSHAMLGSSPGGRQDSGTRSGRDGSGRRERGDMISIKDVARHAGVSVGTVSNVINRPNLVSADIRARVSAAIDELG